MMEITNDEVFVTVVGLESRKDKTFFWIIVFGVFILQLICWTKMKSNKTIQLASLFTFLFLEGEKKIKQIAVF